MLLQNSWRFPKDADTCWLRQDCKKKTRFSQTNMSTYFIPRPPGAFTIFWCLIGPSLPTADWIYPANCQPLTTLTGKLYVQGSSVRVGQPRLWQCARGRSIASFHGVVVKGDFPPQFQRYQLLQENCWVTNGILWQSLSITTFTCLLCFLQHSKL